MQLRLRYGLNGRKEIVLRTSDRIAFKSCRRKWAWSSHLMRNLGSANLAPALWFGSGIHYALEDYHGYKHFKSAAHAFQAYCIATSKQGLRDLPNNAKELYELGTNMMDYYEFKWAPIRSVDQTFIYNGVPQVEVDFEVDIPLDEFPHLKELAAKHGANAVVYRGTIDRMAIDDFGRLWVVEYKTAKVAEQLHFQTDPQVTSYVWAANHIYDRPVAGVAYYQYVKREAKPPAILSSGRISTASNLSTSVPLYSEALLRMYGSLDKAPVANREYLEYLATQETADKDKYIQREYVYRNEHMAQMEAQKVLLELEDMMNPDLPLYPNPTRECSRMCSFLGACVSFDDGGDWETNLESQYAERDQGADRYWRKRMPSAEAILAMEGMGTPDLEDVQVRIQSLTDAQRTAIEAGEASVEFTFHM